MKTISGHKNLERLLRENTGGGRRDLRTVFEDFVEMCATTLSNQCDLRSRDSRKAEYLELAGRYSPEELHRFAQALGELALMLGTERRDVLGELWMTLGLGSSEMGQFFTPSSVARLMALMHADAIVEQLTERLYITVNEPACGGGVMMLELMDVLAKRDVDVSTRVICFANDLSRQAALMAYVQFWLAGIPAEVRVMNTLTLEEFGNPWVTPMFTEWVNRSHSEGQRKDRP